METLGHRNSHKCWESRDKSELYLFWGIFTNLFFEGKCVYKQTFLYKRFPYRRLHRMRKKGKIKKSRGILTLPQYAR